MGHPAGRSEAGLLHAAQPRAVCERGEALAASGDWANGETHLFAGWMLVHFQGWVHERALCAACALCTASQAPAAMGLRMRVWGSQQERPEAEQGWGQSRRKDEPARDEWGLSAHASRQPRAPPRWRHRSLWFRCAQCAVLPVGACRALSMPSELQQLHVCFSRQASGAWSSSAEWLGTDARRRVHMCASPRWEVQLGVAVPNLSHVISP